MIPCGVDNSIVMLKEQQQKMGTEKTTLGCLHKLYLAAINPLSFARQKIEMIAQIL
jgi:hypothetical protein